MAENIYLLKRSITAGLLIAGPLCLAARYIIRQLFPDLALKWRYPVYFSIFLIAAAYSFIPAGRWMELGACTVIMVAMALAKYGSLTAEWILRLAREHREAQEAKTLADLAELEGRRAKANKR